MNRLENVSEIEFSEGDLEELNLATDNLSDGGDIYAQLAQKDKYLKLAAEAGNALLKKNEELQSQIDSMAKEFSRKIEELEEECYSSKKYHQERIAEQEAEIHNLNLDLCYLNKQFENAEKKALLHDEKQERCLRDITNLNESLQRELHQSLGQQVNLLSSRLKFTNEKLTESVCTNLALYLREIAKLNPTCPWTELEILILRAVDIQATNYNMELSFQVNTLKRRIEGRSSLGNGMISSDEFYCDIADASVSMEQFRQLEREKKDLEDAVSQFASEKITLFEDIEKSKTYIESLEQKVKDFQQQMNIAESDLTAAKMSNSQLREQLDEYIMQASLRSFRNNNSLMNELDMSLSDPGLNFYNKFFNNMDDDEHEASVMTSSPKTKKRATVDCSNFDCSNVNSEVHATQSENDHDGSHSDLAKQDAKVLNQQIFELNSKLNCTLKDFNKLSKQYNTTKSQLIEADDNVKCLQQKVEHQDRDIEMLRKEREIIFCDSVPDAVKEALNDRSDALQRESTALLQYEQTKSDMVKLNSQLLDAVQQKLQLSEQLEMWQNDMATLLERQLHRKPSRDKNKGAGPAGDRAARPGHNLQPPAVPCLCLVFSFSALRRKSNLPFLWSFNSYDSTFHTLKRSFSLQFLHFETLVNPNLFVLDATLPNIINLKPKDSWNIADTTWQWSSFLNLQVCCFKTTASKLLLQNLQPTSSENLMSTSTMVSGFAIQRTV
eukprot:gene13986-15444_t